MSSTERKGSLVSSSSEPRPLLERKQSMAASGSNILASLSMSTSRAFDPNTPRAGGAAWNQRDRAEEGAQTEELDSMRRMQLVFYENIEAMREQVILAEENGRSRLVQWESTLKYNLWLWDASADAIRDAEQRARTALLDSEQQWRDTFLTFAVGLFLADDSDEEEVMDAAALVA